MGSIKFCDNTTGVNINHVEDLYPIFYPNEGQVVGFEELLIKLSDLYAKSRKALDEAWNKNLETQAELDGAYSALGAANQALEDVEIRHESSMARVSQDLETALFDLENSYGERDRILADADTTQAELTTTQAELTTTQAQLATTQAQLTTTQAQLATANHAQAQLTTTQTQLTTIQAQLATANRARSTLQYDLGNARGERDRLLDAVNNSQTNGVNPQLAYLRSELALQEANMQERNRELANSQDSLEHARETIDNQRDSLNAAWGELRNKEAEVGELRHLLANRYGHR